MPDEQTSLLPREDGSTRRHRLVRIVVAIVVVVVLIVATLLAVFIWAGGEFGSDRDPLEAANRILSRSPIIDGHVDLPILTRLLYRNNVSAFNLESKMPMHVDIPRLRKGHVGAFFWSVYVDCKEESGPDFLVPTDRVRDTMEQIDVARLMMEQYPGTFSFVQDTASVRRAISAGKIAGILGVEGGHQLGNSLAVLRLYHTLGVRYMTLTHLCHNAFADSGGLFEAPPPLHGGLSPLGEELVKEMNRLGMLVDLSHTSDKTALQAILLSRAPVIWSHSSARGVWNISRNVPDEILAEIPKKDGVVMVNFAPFFVGAPGNSTVSVVADHVEHIARVAGKKHVGIGSDFDGIGSTPAGLEDVSKYPNLIAELYKRGWTKRELGGFAGGNLIRVFERAEKTAQLMQQSEGVKASMEIYKKRTDL